METRGTVIEDGAVLHSKVVVPQAPVPEVPAGEIDQPAPPTSPEPLLQGTKEYAECQASPCRRVNSVNSVAP
jgi:hypothetical protein